MNTALSPRMSFEQAFAGGLLVPTRTAAAVLGVDPIPLVRAGALSAFRFKRTYRFTEAALRDWLNPCPIGPGGERDALNARMSRGIYRSITPCGRGWKTLLDYSVEDLARHLDKQFSEGMGWENMHRWHIDHIRPLASFVITGPDCPEFKKAWALENLQPLWARANAIKGARWTP